MLCILRELPNCVSMPSGLSDCFLGQVPEAMATAYPSASSLEASYQTRGDDLKLYGLPCFLRRPRSLFSATAALVTFAAVVFSISHCYFHSVPHAKIATLPQRSLAGHDTSDEEGSAGALKSVICTEAQGPVDEPPDSIDPEPSFPGTRLSVARGVRRGARRGRRRKVRGKTLQTLNILYKLSRKSEEQTKEVQEPSDSSTPPVSPPAAPSEQSSDTSDTEEEPVEERKGIGKSDKLLEYVMQMARDCEGTPQYESSVTINSVPRLTGSTVTSTAKPDAIRTEGRPPVKRIRRDEIAAARSTADETAKAQFSRSQEKASATRAAESSKLVPTQRGESSFQEMEQDIASLFGEGFNDSPGSLLDFYLSETLALPETEQLTTWLMDSSTEVPLALLPELPDDAEEDGLLDKGFKETEDIRLSMEAGIISNFEQQIPVKGSSNSAFQDSSVGMQTAQVVALPNVIGAGALEKPPTPTTAQPIESVDERQQQQLREEPEPSQSTALIRQDQQDLHDSRDLTTHPFYRTPEPFSGVYLPFIDTNPQRVFRLRYAVPEVLETVRSLLARPMKKEQWWDELMDQMLEATVRWKRQMPNLRKTETRKPLVQALIRALEILRTGSRPSPSLTVWVMRELLCKPSTLIAFRGLEWKAWRDADTEFEKSQ
ncbi:hypothetical protein Efla_001985 [Eimeria flavescens]